MSSLYERLGGIYAIAAVVDRFSDALIRNSIVGKHSKNPQLREWSTKKQDRLPGLKFMRTLWVCDITGGPFKFRSSTEEKHNLNLSSQHCPFKISSKEFDAVASELYKAMTYYKVPTKEKNEVMQAFAAHKNEITNKKCKLQLPPLLR